MKRQFDEIISRYTQEKEEEADQSDSESVCSAASEDTCRSSVADSGYAFSKMLDAWEAQYIELDKAVKANNFPRADKLCEALLEESRWSKRVLSRPWTHMPNGKVRTWCGVETPYPNAYRVVDGIREAWICMLMDYCKWDRAVKAADVYIHDARCMYLTGKAQVSLNKLHALLESRRMRDAFGFFQELLDGSHKMNEILRIVEKEHPYQWHYSLARIHFLHNELEKAQHHAEMACRQLESGAGDEEPLQTRMWVNLIRAWTTGLTCVVSKNAQAVNQVLDLWERTVCDLDRKSIQNTRGLRESSVFGRLKFVEFLLIAARAFPELEVTTYADVTKPDVSNVISIGKTLIARLRSVTNELLQRGNLSVEVTNSRYHPLLDQALIQLGYLSTSLEGLLNNWTLVVDAGPVGNQGRFANHCDDPNAVLAIGQSGGIRTRTIRAIKSINRGDEITVHYGPSYWDTVTQNRKSTISRKYDCVETANVAPSSHRQTVAPPPAKKQKGRPKSRLGTRQNPPAAKSPQNFYGVEQRYGFKFFDGIVSDLNGSGLPALVLLQSLGEMGTCAEAYDMEASCRRKGIRVAACPPTHAAFPGKMLVADRDFDIGEEICVYAGVLSRMPVEQLKLNESDYMSTVCNSTCGPYGFELEDVYAKSGCVFKAYQRDLPTLTPLTAKGLRIPNACPPVDLSGVKDIRGIGAECTKKLIDALQHEHMHDMLRRLFKRLNNLPDKQWRTQAQIEIKRTFSRFVTAEPDEIKEELEDAPVSVDCDLPAATAVAPPEENIPETIRNVWTPGQLRGHIAKSQELFLNRPSVVWDM